MKASRQRSLQYQTCTADQPYNGEGRAIHPNAIYLDDRDYGNGETTAVYRCPVCSLRFEVELAQ